MQNAYFLGIDGGTSYIKAAIMDQNFNLIDEERQNVTIYTPFEGASEIDMNEYWQCMCSITQRLKEKNTSIWGKIVGVGITAQGDGLWPIDQNGLPVRNALLWNDTRSKSVNIDEIKELDDIIISEHTNRIYYGSVIALLKWMKVNEPDNFSRIRWALHCKDWLNYKLTGKIYTDYTDASTALFNIKKGEYSQKILDVLDLSECINILPKVVKSTDVIGYISKPVSELTGICEGTPVIEGALDVCTVALGNDVINTGQACTIIGTTLGNEVVIDPSDVNPNEKRGLLMHHVIPDKYLWILPTLSGASSMDFIKAMLFPDVPYPDLEEQLERIPLGCDGLIFYPFINGERAPFKNALATAGFFGLTHVHTELHIMRSVFEGLAYSFYDCISVFGSLFDTIYFSGGASKSDMVCQMFCDVLGKPAQRIQTKEAGVLGIIRILQVALGYAEDFYSFTKQPTTGFTPDMNRHVQYMELFELYDELRHTMEPFWVKRDKIIR